MKKQKELARMLSVVNELNAQLTAQLADKDAEAAHWKANHDNMVKKNALLSQRHDLPVDRIQAAKHFDDLNAEVVRLRDRLEAVYEAGCWGISHVGAANYASRESEANTRIQDAYYNLSTTQQPNPPACCYCDREINPLLDEWHWLPSGTRTVHDKCVSYVPTTQQEEG
jgi:hypothetical protein